MQTSKLSQVCVSAINVRKDTNELNGDDDTSIEDLAQTIMSQGLINPISGRPKSGSSSYEVIAEQRLLAAFKFLSKRTIPCSVMSKEMTDNEAVVHSLGRTFKDKITPTQGIYGSIADILRRRYQETM